MKILVIDDLEINRHSAKDLEEDGHEVIVVGTAEGAGRAGKVDGKNLFRILDREEAIRKAIAMAEAQDLVLITGKGSEPVMAVSGGKKIPWDDRAVARRALKTV